jgi:hypothetical protein
MANVASIRAPQSVRFNIDTAANAAPFSITMNRSAEVQQIVLVRQDAVGGGNTTFRNDATTIATINSPANQFDVASGSNLQNVNLAQGASLSIQTSLATILFRAYVVILPGI